MSASGVSIAYAPVHAVEQQGLNWFALRTRSRHEKVVEKQLHGQGIEAFSPTITEMRQWSDRRKMVETPLFAGYAFVRIAHSPEERVRVLRTQGVVELVGAQGVGIPIPSEQIEAVRAVVAGKLPVTQHVFLKVGQRVRVRGGSLDGVEGILVAQNGSRNLVISVEPIQRSLSIRIEGYQVEPV
ncbi:MAG TPA: UpxY family transcription antiterminator [Candidatus Acidoferrum sp.]|jgi:transcription antitermination factor NusG|nr:UpxY family transcription antiterminator [Candidatus Acidoferrum sp.]